MKRNIIVLPVQNPDYPGTDHITRNSTIVPILHGLSWQKLPTEIYAEKQALQENLNMLQSKQISISLPILASYSKLPSNIITMSYLLLFLRLGTISVRSISRFFLDLIMNSISAWAHFIQGMFALGSSADPDSN